MKRNTRKALGFVLLGFVFCFLSMFAAMFMWFSTILPVRIAGHYVLGNQVLRYEIYAALFVVFCLSAKLANYGYAYLKKSKKRAIGR